MAVNIKKRILRFMFLIKTDVENTMFILTNA